MFLFPVRHVTDQGKDVGGECDLEALGSDAAAGEFQGRRDQRGFGQSDPVNPRQILQRGIRAGFIQDLQDPPGQGHDIMGSGPAAQQNGQKFVVGKGLGAFLLKFFPGAILQRDIEDSFHGSYAKRIQG
jgi:hypothetical protein